MSYIGKEPEILRSALPTPSPAPTANVISLTASFDTKIVAYGFPHENSNTGRVVVYEYTEYSDSWVQKSDLNGPHSNSYFGKSIDMEWDGDRIVVGSNGASNVYIYDWDGSAYQNYSNVIESPSGSGSDFGFSVCIAKNDPDTIVIGSPAHNNVFVYQLISDTWTQTFSNIGTDINNLIPYSNAGTQVFDTSNNLVTTSEYNRYGEHVKISHKGDHIVVGQTGSVIYSANVNNTTNFTITDGDSKVDDGELVIATAFYTFGYLPNGDNKYINRQLGSVRVFKSTNANWNTSNAQVGNVIYGERNFAIENRPSLTDREGLTVVNWANGGWGFPAHGSSFDISEDGNLLVVGAPNYSRPVTYQGHNGKVYTYKLGVDTNNQDVWKEIHALPGYTSSRYGQNVCLDYSGTRLAVNGCNLFNDMLDVFDLAENTWYNVIPSVLYSRKGNDDQVPLYISDGKTIVTTRYVWHGSVGQKYLFYNLNLTQGFQGNSLFSGYIATPLLYVGSNDANENVSNTYVNSKRISFGGTLNDNTYENTIIENRVYHDNIRYNGSSELMINKVGPYTSGDSFEQSYLGLDIIRLKASEIHLDSWSYLDGDKYAHYPMLVMTCDACIGIAHRNPNFEAQDGYYQNSIDTHAILDVNGSGYIRNKLNVNYEGRSEIKGYMRTQGILFWDTRQEDTVDGTTVYSRSWPIPSKIMERVELDGTMINATYSQSNCAFSFGSGKNGYVECNDTKLSPSSESPKVSLWLKINDTQSTYNDEVIFSIGDVIGYRNELMITTSGIKVKFFASSNYILSSNYTFVPGSWYHIFYKFPAYNDEPSVSNTILYINNVELSLSGSGTPSSVSYYKGTLRIGHASNGIHNAYIGMVNYWTAYAWKSPSVQHLYDNGPPDELLSVGGTATIQNKLGVGVTNPTEALEVSGNVLRTGRTFVKRITYTSVNNEYPYIYLGQFNTQSEPSKIHIIDTGSSKFSGSTFTVVRHYNSTPIINGTQGSAYVNYTFYYQSIDVYSYYLWVRPVIYDSGTYDIHVDSPNYSYGTVQTIPSTPTPCLYGLTTRGLFDDVKVHSGCNVVIADSFQNSNNKLHIRSAVGSDDYIYTVQHNGQFRMVNGLGTYGSRAFEFTLIDNGTGVIQANENSVGYNNISLNPGGGNVGVGTLTPTYKLQVNGSLYYTSGGLNGSDDRIKYNEQNIQGSLDIINKLKPRRYDKIMEFPENYKGQWIPTDEEWESVKNDYVHGEEYGFIAQDVRNIPELSFLVHGEETSNITKSISIKEYDSNTHAGYTPNNVYVHSVTSNVIPTNVYDTLPSEEQGVYTETTQSYYTTIHTDTPLSLNYNGIFVLAVGAIQELDKKNKALEAQLTSVLARLDALENPS